MSKKIFIYEKNLLSNYNYLSSLKKDNMQIAPVLKSNAYGHGIVEIAKVLENVNPPFFCVNSFDEAYMLYKAGIKTPLHIMGHVDPEDLKEKKLPFSYTIYNYSQLNAINKFQKGASVHIFIDTGMHREGFRLSKLPDLLQNLKNFHNLKVVGAMSHFASADLPGSRTTKKQIKKFQLALKMIEDSGITLTYQHIAASAGFLNFVRSNNIFIGNIARIGKAIYGIDPRGKNPHLKPVLKFSTQIVQVKVLKPNSKIGYGGTFTTKRTTTLGIIPIGYFDGLDRRLSNKGTLLVNNKKCPIIGRISMNITTIDISKLKNPRVGTEVVVFSNDSTDPNSIENMAKISKTIPYDIAIRINPFIKRSYCY